MTDPVRNTHPEFVGVEALKARQREQLAAFRAAASARAWKRIHDDHYDWWMFPIDKPSRLGFAWTVYRDEIDALRSDPAWMADYLEGVRLEALAWGWDLDRAMPVEPPDPHQGWHDWPIRLEKLTRSLEIFGCDRELASMVAFARQLADREVSFRYGSRDLKDGILQRGRK